MQKQIVIAVDSSPHAAQAVNYATRLSTIIPEIHFVLLHIHPTISGYLLEEAERSVKARAEIDRMVRKNQSASLEVLEKLRNQMVRQGLAEERIELKSQPRYVAVTDDILALSQAAVYDAVMVGRRGVSYIQEMITGSVTANLVSHSTLTPIWVVDGEVNATSVILAVDGSPSSLRALDHLAFIMGGECRIRILMLHVQPRLQDYCALDSADRTDAAAEEVVLTADKRCLDNFFGQARAILSKCGVAEDRVEMKTVIGGLAVPKAILSEARQGGFGTVVLGKSGQSRSRFFGSVSAKVLQKAENMAVWIVP
jgi:nucleotide-binding universal stress UspA family protein